MNYEKKKWDVYACLIKGYPVLTTRGINTLYTFEKAA
jgi:hypothetical protein